MNKNRFISELSRKLRGIPKQDYDDAMNYYIEYFMDAGIGDDEDVTARLGTPDEVAARIKEEYGNKQIVKASKEGGVKNSSKAIWYILLGLFAAPIAFPIAIAIAAVIFAVLATVVIVIAALLLSSVGVVIAGICAIPAIFWAETGAQVMVLIGIACVGISFGSLMCILFYKLGSLIVRGIIRMIGFIGSKKRSKRERRAMQ